jgi:Zn-finger domain-containing protein
MKKNTWLLIALITIIFVSGVAAGFFTGRLTTPKHSRKGHKRSFSKEDKKNWIKKRIYRKLNLTDEQKKSTQIIVDNWLNAMWELRQRHAPQYLAVFNAFHTKINPILNDKQKKEIDKWRNKFVTKGENNAAK